MCIRDSLGLVFLLLVRKLAQRLLILGLDDLGILAGGGVLVVDALVGLHYLAYHVEIRHELGEALGAEDDGEVCIAVSYTHLDVYKRQASGRACMSRPSAGESSAAAMTTPQAARKMCIRDSW